MNKVNLNEEICDLYRIAKIKKDNLGKFSLAVKSLLKRLKDEGVSVEDWVLNNIYKEIKRGRFSWKITFTNDYERDCVLIEAY